jgi:hypothetical protein
LFLSALLGNFSKMHDATITERAYACWRSCANVLAFG